MKFHDAAIKLMHANAAGLLAIKLGRRTMDYASHDARQGGVSPTDGISHLVDSGGGTLAYHTSDSDPGPEIPMFSLSTLLNSKPRTRYTPFILKIDIEGAESALFETDPAVLDQFPHILMEPHD